jgi:hypothetical protein
VPLQFLLPLPRCNRLIDHRCCRCPIPIAVAPINKDIMSSNRKKRGSSPGTTKDKTPSKKSRRGSSSLGRPSKAANFVAAEEVALCKAYVNVTLNPIDGVERKASSFWDHIHRKFCLLLKPDNPSEALPDRDSESLKNRFQRQIQKKMNVYNRYYK